MSQTFILDNNKQSYPFDAAQLHDSIISVCMSSRSYEGEARTTAEQVCRKVVEWLSSKQEVTENDLRRVTSDQLSRYQPEAAYLYKYMEMML